MRKLLALFFSLLGLFVCVYLWWMYTSPSVPMACMGKGCEVVRASRFAHIFGVPMPAFGFLMYSVLVLLLLAEPLVNEKLGTLARRAAFGISAAGFAFSLYLTGIEAFVLHAWCTWCVTQAVAVTGIVLATWRWRSGYSDSSAALSTVRMQSATVLVALVIGVPAFLHLQQKAKVPPPELPTASAEQIAEHLIRPDSHVLGDVNAPVTIIEFGDLQCASCAAAHRTNDELRKRFGAQIRFVYRQFPVVEQHPYAQKAAEASECAAEQGKFWEAVDRFYRSEGQLDVASLRKYAAELGLDLNRYDACMSSGASVARVRRDREDGLFLGVRSTPTFIVGRQMIEGALDTERFGNVIQAELARVGSAAPAAANVPAKQESGSAQEPVQTTAGRSPAAKEATPTAAKKETAAKVSAPVASTAQTNPARPAVAMPPSGSGAGFSGLAGFRQQPSNSPFTLLQGSTGCDRNGSTGPEAAQIHTVEARELHQNQSVFVDVRSRQDFDKGRIAGAINVPLNEVEVRLKSLPKDRTIVLYESGRASGEDSCAASKAAARVLLARGFQKVKVYKEGLAAWEKEGLPVQH